MVTVSSAFISSRRERIRFSVLSASGCAFKAAFWVDVLRAVFRALGKTDLDNTDVVRDHSFHCIAGCRILVPADHSRHVGLTVSIRQTPLSEVRKPRPASGANVGKAPEGQPFRPERPDAFKTADNARSRCYVPLFQLPSGLRSPVDDRLIFSPVRKTQAGGRSMGSRPACFSGMR
jgi:hypothetical protein